MAEFEEQLNAILSDPKAMGQIMAIAKALSPDNGGSSDGVQAESTPAKEGGGESPANLDELLSPLGDMNSKLAQAALRLFAEYNATDNRKTALLTALLPFLKEERYDKVDKAIQITRLSRVVRVSFHLLKGGDEPV